MFSKFKDQKNDQQTEFYTSVMEGLKDAYKTKLLPIEERYSFHHFHSPKMTDSDFEAKPLILIFGQYSTGKTTLIRYLLGKDFPGQRIGPEPTTDRFTVIMKATGDSESIVPGNALVADSKNQFGPLTKFGTAFLNRFQGSLTHSPVLDSMTIVDTPGILSWSGVNNKVDRGYDFAGVLAWFAEKADRILLLFDAQKSDISDEFSKCMEALKGHDEKVKILFNKADILNPRQLMRAYGALMWSLRKIISTPEVPRIYIGSFWDHPFKCDANMDLFEAEELALFVDLRRLPRYATLRKVSDLVKRSRLAKAHAYLMSTLYEEMPRIFVKLRKERRKRQLLEKLADIYVLIQNEHRVPAGDFPDIEKMKDLLKYEDLTKFSHLKSKMLETVDNMVSVNISRLMTLVPLEDIINNEVSGGAFDCLDTDVVPYEEVLRNESAQTKNAMSQFLRGGTNFLKKLDK